MHALTPGLRTCARRPLTCSFGADPRPQVNYICQVPGGGCYGQSAIHFAAMTGQADVIKKLIAAGADVNASVLGEWDPTSEDSMAGGFQPLQVSACDRSRAQHAPRPSPCERSGARVWRSAQGSSQGHACAR